jgi:hypothetical protein
MAQPHTKGQRRRRKGELHSYRFFLMKSGFLKIIFKIFLYLFVSRKVGQQKTLSDQRKI